MQAFVVEASWATRQGGNMEHQFAHGTRVERVFAEVARAVEIGLFIYQVDDPADASSLRLVYANPASVAATGVSVDDVLGKPMRDAFPNLMQTDVPGLCLEIALGGAARDFGNVQYQDDRLSPGVYSVRAFPLPERSVGISFTSVTAQQMAEQRAVDTLESMTDGFYALDADWRFTYVNRRSELILKRRREDLLGKNIWVEFPEAVGTVFYEVYHQALRDQVALNFDTRYDPLGVDANVRVYPITGGLAVYFLDVTKQKLVEAQLRQAQRLEAIGRVTAGVAHDFNNLLTVICGCASLGQEEPADSTAAYYFDQIGSAGEKATELTRQLLAFSREQELAPERLDLNDVVREFATLLEHLLPPDIALELELSSEPVPVFVDRAKVEQILLNLVVNSRDAIGSKGAIRVSTMSVAPARDADQVSTPSAWLEVADDGCGIPDDVLPRIFEPFFTTKPAETGTGLGLATLYGIVSQSRGDVFVETTVDVGTSMTVVLPTGEPTDGPTTPALSAPALPIA